MSEYEKLDALKAVFCGLLLVVPFMLWLVLYQSDRIKHKWVSVVIPVVVFFILLLALKKPFDLIRDSWENSPEYTAEIEDKTKVLEEFLSGQQISEDAMWWKNEIGLLSNDIFDEYWSYREILSKYIEPKFEPKSAFGQRAADGHIEWVDFRGYCREQVDPVLKKGYLVQRVK